MNKIITFAVSLLIATNIHALQFDLPTGHNNIVGKVQYIKSQVGDNFSRVGRRYDIGYYELVEANPGINPDQTLEIGTKLLIPSQFILPAVPRKGVVINLPELRLYYYPPGEHTVLTFPVGIGREGWSTPSTLTHIYAKIKDPTWHVPKDIREARAQDGIILPESVPPGPDNPLGFYEFRFAMSGSYLMHGTNDFTGVGRRSSAGCIRLLPEDVEYLYSQVPVNTTVNILNDPYKVGWNEDSLYVEAHLPLQEQQKDMGDTVTPALKLVENALKQRSADVDWTNVKKVIATQSGYPVLIGVATGDWIPQPVATTSLATKKKGHKRVLASASTK